MSGNEIKLNKGVVNNHMRRIKAAAGKLESDAGRNATRGVTNYPTHVMATDNRNDMCKSIGLFTDKLEKCCANVNRMADAFVSLDKKLSADLSESAPINQNAYRTRRK